MWGLVFVPKLLQHVSRRGRGGGTPVDKRRAGKAVARFDGLFEWVWKAGTMRAVQQARCFCARIVGAERGVFPRGKAAG